MEAPLPAHTFEEVRYYLMVTACPQCGKGPWQMDQTGQVADMTGPLNVSARCEQCGQEKTFEFLCESLPAEREDEVGRINPTDRTSRIVDLAQWLSLFYMLAESAASKRDKTATRRAGFAAALCLAEALKFYGDNELPPESAFFGTNSLATFHEHPANFARQKLRDLQSRLPTLNTMAEHVEKDRQTRRKRWWQFWK